MGGLRKGREKHERGSTTELRESLHIVRITSSNVSFC